MEARHLLKMLKDEGWYLGDSEGACRQYVHRERPGVITVCVRYTDELGPMSQSSAKEAAGRGTHGELDIVVEPTGTGFSAYVEGLPGCIATGATEEEARERVTAAAHLHRSALTRPRTGRA